MDFEEFVKNVQNIQTIGCTQFSKSELYRKSFLTMNRTELRIVGIFYFSNKNKKYLKIKRKGEK